MPLAVAARSASGGGERQRWCSCLRAGPRLPVGLAVGTAAHPCADAPTRTSLSAAARPTARRVLSRRPGRSSALSRCLQCLLAGQSSRCPDRCQRVTIRACQSTSEWEQASGHRAPARASRTKQEPQNSRGRRPTGAWRKWHMDVPRPESGQDVRSRDAPCPCRAAAPPEAECPFRPARPFRIRSATQRTPTISADPKSAPAPRCAPAHR